MIVFFCFLLLVNPLWSVFSAEEYLRRIHAHLTIEDPKSALSEAKEAFSLFPDNNSVHHAYILSLARAHLLPEAIAAYEMLDEEHTLLLEEIAWSILEKGQTSTQYAIRLHALIGAYFAQDRRSVRMLLQAMQDTNAILRSVAIQLASSYRDEILQKSLEKLLYEEKNWLVRSELIKAVGRMQIQKTTPYLVEILESPRSTFEEKELAMKALITIHEDIDTKKLEQLAKSRKALLRQLACVLVERLEKEDMQEVILPLIKDARAEVRIAALQAFSSVIAKKCSLEEAKAYLSTALQDVDSAVAITAAWSATLIDTNYGLRYLEEALLSPSQQKRCLASAALAALGDRGVHLAEKYLRGSFDPYVRVHLAICLMGQRRCLVESQNALYEFFMNKTAQLQYGRYQNTPFLVFRKSEVPYLPQIPNYPVVMDEAAQLQLLSFLAILQDPRAKIAMQKFLSKKTWGISSLASSLLMKEGDEDSLALIASLLDHENPSIRLQAAVVLAYLGKDEKAKAVLQEAYFTESRQNKKQILEALGQIAKPDSASFFLQLLDEPFEILRILAASGIIQCLRR